MPLFVANQGFDLFDHLWGEFGDSVHFLAVHGPNGHHLVHGLTPGHEGADPISLQCIAFAMLFPPVIWMFPDVSG